MFYEAVVVVKISNLLICFYSFELSCPILEKDTYYRKCLIKYHYFSNLVCIIPISFEENGELDLLE